MVTERQITDTAASTHITYSGFKHPDSIYGQHFRQLHTIQKPGLLEQIRQSGPDKKGFSDFKKDMDRARHIRNQSVNSTIRYTKFGVNLGPNRPVLPLGKHERIAVNQSPNAHYRKEELYHAVLNLKP